MFYDKPNVQKIDEKIFYYPNFVPQEKVKQINKIMDQYTKEEIGEKNYIDAIDWYRDKISPRIPELIEVWDLISEFLAPEYIIHPTLHLQVIRPGDGGMFIHCDSPGEGNHEDLTQIDKWNTCCVIHYGAVAYFGDFEGGENLYPNQQLEFQVKPGDLIIHGAHSDVQHGVKEVTSGIRYAYANFVLPTEKNPGTFATYGTKEDLERKKDPLELWEKPIIANL